MTSVNGASVEKSAALQDERFEYLMEVYFEVPFVVLQALPAFPPKQTSKQETVTCLYFSF